MNRQQLNSLLLSFLPLLLFVVVDEFLSQHYPEDQATRYALILALIMGIGQFLYVLVREKRVDRMLLLDTGLIVLMGGISLLSGNDFFFKLKPALIQGAMVIVLAVMAFLKPAMLEAMSGRFMQGQTIPEAQMRTMQKSAQKLTVLLFLHTLLIVYAALYLSKPSWAFISGPLLYIVAGTYAGLTIFLARLRRKKSE